MAGKAAGRVADRALAGGRWLTQVRHIVGDPVAAVIRTPRETVVRPRLFPLVPINSR